jgi:hypothetical protein
MKPSGMAKKVVMTCGLILLGAALSGAPVAAEQFQLFPFDPSLSHYIQNYHNNPDPKGALDFFFRVDLGRFERLAEESNRPHARAVLMAFYVHILHESPDEVLPFARRLALESRGGQAAFGTEAIAYGATKHRREALKLITEVFGLPPATLDEYDAMQNYPYPGLEAEHWHTLDVLWASFFATGERMYIRKIVKALYYFQVMDKEYKERLQLLAHEHPTAGTKEYKEWVSGLTARESLFSLTLNALSDPEILEALRDIAEKENGRVSILVGTIIKRVDKARARKQLSHR